MGNVINLVGNVFLQTSTFCRFQNIPRLYIGYTKNQMNMAKCVLCKASRVTKIDCNHNLCDGCLNGYLTKLIAQQLEHPPCPFAIHQLSCPISGCSAEISDHVLSTLAEKELIVNYKKWLTSAFDVAYSGKLVHCSKSTCTLEGSKWRCKKCRKGGSIGNELWHQIYKGISGLESVFQQSVRGGKCTSSTSTTSKIWAKGVGFGGSNDPGTIKKMEAAKEEESKIDSSVQITLQYILDSLSQGPPTVTLCALLSKGDILSRVILMLVTNDSMLDICERQGLYSTMIRLLEVIAPYEIITVTQSRSSSCEVFMHKFRKLYKQAQVVLKYQSVDGSDEAAVAEKICKCFEGLCKQFNFNLTDGDYGVRSCPSQLSESYLKAIHPLQFRFVKMENHYFKDDKYQDNNSNSNHARMRHIQKEIASLATSLPLEWDSLICLCVDEERIDLLKALITGPPETPYQNGIFIFDIALPPDYPQSPPKVHFLTTGGGKVRFNPNLYNNGTVCLSLLGTWHEGLGWIPSKSTLLQVLVSIQSLILVKDPYYNEPGMHENPTAANAESLRHKNNTLSYAILQTIKCPDKMFQEVIVEHFKHKKNEIEEQCNSWAPRSSEDIISAIEALT